MPDTRSANHVIVNRRFLEIARDPHIIPGVHHYCDEWCDCCALTARCLAFRCTKEHRRGQGRGDMDPTFQSMEEVVQFTRDLAAIEGTPTDELDALLAGGEAATGMRTSHPLAQLAWEYAVRASRFLSAAHDPAPAPTAMAAGPTPCDVVTWFHLRIYLKLLRALVGQAHTAAGTLERREDAAGCAKLTLVSIERSRAALSELAGESVDDGINVLMALLDDIERGVDEQFPEARGFIRLGLDVPVT